MMKMGPIMQKSVKKKKEKDHKIPMYLYEWNKGIEFRWEGERKSSICDLI